MNLAQGPQLVSSVKYICPHRSATVHLKVLTGMAMDVVGNNPPCSLGLAKPILGCESVSHPHRINRLSLGFGLIFLCTLHPLLGGSSFEITPVSLHSASRTAHFSKINHKLYSPPRKHVWEPCFPFHLKSQQNLWHSGSPFCQWSF